MACSALPSPKRRQVDRTYRLQVRNQRSPNARLKKRIASMVSGVESMLRRLLGFCIAVRIFSRRSTPSFAIGQSEYVFFRRPLGGLRTMYTTEHGSHVRIGGRRSTSIVAKALVSLAPDVDSGGVTYGRDDHA